MPAERLPMRKVREVLRLRHACGVSERLIAQSLGIGRTSVASICGAPRCWASPGRWRSTMPSRSGGCSRHPAFTRTEGIMPLHP